jgi:hypothetical protein
MLSSWMHYSSDPQTRIYSYMDLCFLFLSAQFLLNLKLCMNIVHCIMYPFVYLVNFFMHFL